ncbi:MAG: protein-glutamate O-methyltransferase CheR [Proteobacteria bacterium]|nr:protein-glutamate O-methyltransferase CheR [Pseudomonadota bacterium]MBU1388355.1 protein-glutamate O-methyltransferase CheR [Pseudomonadota bacterium]MBU1542821.1 protein-glutamate O-methyltransferase CheR [Pseudomonadota bacterium]MBU2481847.1 protein-glutamate O-methyltransferase CheR [Pseudomonadota bacterium]
MKITIKALMELAVIVHNHSGIVLTKDKAYLIKDRLQPLMEEYGLSSFEDLISRAKGSSQLINHIVDRMTTNETSFFRDKRPFVLLKEKLLPDWQATRKKNCNQLNIWSCACSTGQEVYSIAITLMEYFKTSLSSHHVKIKATDISDSAIVKASRGLYSNYEVSRGLDAAQLKKYFTWEDPHWKIKDELRSMAYFEKMNLLRPEIEYGKFDIIFCRNVAIYFSRTDRQRLFQSLFACLNDNGALIIGATETLFDINEQLKRVDCGGMAYYCHK